MERRHSRVRRVERTLEHQRQPTPRCETLVRLEIVDIEEIALIVVDICTPPRHASA